MSNNINFDYKNLSPFKWFVLENFPFIEADFDALTDWQLFCKLGKEINKIIDSQNIVGEQAEILTTAFNNLKNFVDNYFNNLDVQDEINNKLDLMASDGTLDKIINQDIFSQINNDITKNTDDITKNTTDITKNTDDITKNTDDIDTLKTNQLSIFKNFKGKVCYFSDSYGNIETCPVNWCDELNKLLGTEVLLSSRWNGSGFLGRGGAPSWPNELKSIINQTTQEQRDDVSALIIAGGFNDRGYTETQILNAMELFNNIAKTNFPNATIYLACIGWTIDNVTSDLDITGGFMYNLQVVLPAYSQCGKFGWKFLENCQYVMHDFSYFQDDKVHPNEIGSKAIASAMYSALNGNCGVHKNWTAIKQTNRPTNIQSISGGSGHMKLDNEIITMTSSSDDMKVAFTEQTITKNTFFPIFNIISGYHIPDQYRPIKHNTIIYTDSSYSNYVEGQIVLLNGQYGIIPFKDITTNFIIIPQQNIKFNCMMG